MYSNEENFIENNKPVAQNTLEVKKKKLSFHIMLFLPPVPKTYPIQNACRFLQSAIGEMKLA